MKEVYLKTAIAVFAIVATVLVLERVRFNFKYSDLITKLNEGQRVHEESEKQFTKTLALKQAQIERLNKHFAFVSEQPVIRQTPADIPGTAEKEAEKKSSAAVPSQTQEVALPPFAQFSKNPDILSQAQKIADKIVDKSPAGVASAFQIWQRSEGKRPATLIVDGIRVIDSDAALLEEVSRLCGLTPTTEIIWDLRHFTRTCVTTIASPDSQMKTEIVTYPNPLQMTNPLISQKKFQTVVFPFEPVMLAENENKKLLLKEYSFPVGGLYVYRLDIQRAHDCNAQYWNLELQFPDPPESTDGLAPVPYKLQVLSLQPNTSVVSHVSGNNQTFRIEFINGRSSILVAGDQVVFPENISAYCTSDKDTPAFLK